MEHDCILAEADRNSEIGPPKIFNHYAGKFGSQLPVIDLVV
jgi:hypothetical protein